MKLLWRSTAGKVFGFFRVCQVDNHLARIVEDRLGSGEFIGSWPVPRTTFDCDSDDICDSLWRKNGLYHLAML